ncbi:MAG: hypothetical protein QOD83_802 [Solirubrobacteraceae bacterium]|nr:hypothetical protein [Solirubrobacteraceae bacterium]
MKSRPRAFITVTAILLTALFPAGAPASPGVPDPPTVLFSEGFENNPSTAVTPVTAYQGAPPTNQTYKTDPAYAPNATSCNGLITAYASPRPYCVSSTADANVRLMARKLGVFAGDATPDDNHVVSAYTDLGYDPGANKVELETVQPLTLPGTGSRFLVFSADGAAATCGVGSNPPLFAFFLLTGPDEIPLASSPTDICAKGSDLGDHVIGGRITSEGSVLFSGSALGIRLRNAQPSGYGNDHAFDNILVSDASPQLDKAFGAASVPLGRPTELTFTVTNTAELTAKNGWSFVDKLPAGLQVANPAGESSTCSGGVVTTASGAQTVQATGNLAAGQTSCVVTVNVVGVSAGVVRNGADQLTTKGLREPAQPAIVTIVPTFSPTSTPAACSDSKDNDGDGKVDREDSGCIIKGSYVPLKDSENSITPLAQCSQGQLQLTDVYGLRGRTVLRGVAGPEAVGVNVSIFSSGKRVATATVRGDLSFSTTAALPPKSIRNTNAARFEARLGTQRSLKLKFARRMTETVARRLSATSVQIGGRVTAPLAQPVAAVRIRASSQCPGRTSFRGPVVARGVRVRSRGRWTARVTLPSSLRGTRVFLRAETRVRKTTRNPKRFPTFSLIQGVTLK